MSKIFRMERTGVFQASSATENQCGKVGVIAYSYKVVVLLGKELDEKGFTLDHNVIDINISNSNIYGSCEEMQKKIYDNIKNLFIPGNKIIGYKCTIKPLDYTPNAFIEYIVCKKDRFLTLLN